MTSVYSVDERIRRLRDDLKTLGLGPGMWGRQAAAAVLGRFDHDLSVEEIAAALAPDDVSPDVLRKRIKGVEKGHEFRTLQRRRAKLTAARA